ncbi:MAG: hypothetical protein M3041_16495, partial [Acidobacteriota bacterium]|nr:hypothetical protein [Acidobacteriota bacterium]
ARRNEVRTITDIDILAFRFPSGLPIGDPTGKRAPQGLDVSELDSGLGVPPDAIDMIIGEVKEGRVGINMGTRDPEVLKVVIGRLGDAGSEIDRVVGDLLQDGATKLPTGVNMRLVAFGAFPPGAPVPPCRIISLGHVLAYLQGYVHRHWKVLRHLQFKDPALGFLMTIEKARRGHAGRRGEEGVELVTSREPRRRAFPRARVPGRRSR